MDRGSAFPFVKVANQLKNGTEDSVVSFFSFASSLNGKDGNGLQSPPKN
jgi:hypothetical protein